LSEEFQVNELDLLRQMVQNFNKPLELIREAISNAYDAGANNIDITIKRQLWEGEQRWVIRIKDDGAGMVRDEPAPNDFTGSLGAFFRLGGSQKGEKQYQPVGEKCLGIKIALRSQHIKVKTWAGPNFPIWVAECERPWAAIFDGKFPVPVFSQGNGENPSHSFTEIEVVGFYDNDATHFQADEVEDYIRWFTKWGSFENRIRAGLNDQAEMLEMHLSKFRPVPSGVVSLEAPGSMTVRRIPFGHPFPDCCSNPIIPNQKIDSLLNELNGLPYDQMLERLDKAKRSHWRYYIETGTFDELPDVTWEAVISVEGEEAKRRYNPFLRQRLQPKKFSYKTESRYGLWLCKDFFCVEQRNSIAMDVLEKEGQRTRFKILLNCQNFVLNNDRNKVGGDANLMRGIESVAKSLVSKMVEDDSWEWMKIIEEETEVRTSIKQDKQQLQQRSVQAEKKPWLLIENEPIFFQPATEAETVLLLERLRYRFPQKFGFFEPIDWRTDEGIDCVVRSNEPGEKCRFVEFKRDLGAGHFNHTFASLHFIVCWQVKALEGSLLEDPAKKKRKLKRYPSDEYELPQTAPWTLEGEQQTIKVYSLKDILVEKHGVHFSSPAHS
jgi:hypothetical protein